MICNARPKSVFGTQVALASGHHLASQHALRCLADGGSLVDAMVSASATLAVVLPHAGSLGGCGMMMYYDAATGEVHALNASGRAPGSAKVERFTNGMPQRGTSSAVVPTLVRLWARAHERFGRITLRELLAPAIALARDGCNVAEELARNLRLSGPLVRSQPGFDTLFMPGGALLEAGQRIRQPALAEALNAIAHEGERGFYEGASMRSLTRFSQGTNGLLDAIDFAHAQADWVQSWTSPTAGHAVHVMPPNSVGVLMLQQLQRWDRHGCQLGAEGMAQDIEHALAVIAKGRTRIGDPAQVSVAALDARSFGVDTVRASAEWRAAFANSRAGVGDTTGFVAMDAQGNALAMLQSVFQPFGSGAVDPGTGILLNNRMFDFDTEPGSVNCVAPHRRPSHTLNPWLLLRDGRATMAAVSPGGVSQTTTGFQIATGALGGMATLGELVARPRWSLARDGTILLEPGLPQAVAHLLRERGHSVETDSQHEFYFGSVKAVRRNASGNLEAAADARRQAVALGF